MCSTQPLNRKIARDSPQNRRANPAYDCEVNRTQRWRRGGTGLLCKNAAPAKRTRSWNIALPSGPRRRLISRCNQGERMLTIADVRAAASRISGAVRPTPLVAAEPLRAPLGEGKVSFKLECLQVTGSFKARGAISKLKLLSEDEIARGLVTASGGNHGLAIAYAGWLTGRPATIFVPENVSPGKAAKIKQWGAELVITGKAWDDSNRAALAHVARTGKTYVHPFADPAIMAGQGTIALELFEQDPEIDTLIVAIGGGWLI